MLALDNSVINWSLCTQCSLANVQQIILIRNTGNLFYLSIVTFVTLNTKLYFIKHVRNFRILAGYYISCKCWLMPSHDKLLSHDRRVTNTRSAEYHLDKRNIFLRFSTAIYKMSDITLWAIRTWNHRNGNLHCHDICIQWNGQGGRITYLTLLIDLNQNTQKRLKIVCDDYAVILSSDIIF